MNFTPNLKVDKGEEEAYSLKKIASVRDYMTPQLIYFKADQDITEAIDVMLKNRISGGPVLDDDHHLIGVLSEKDCLKILVNMGYHNEPLNQKKVEAYMSRDLTSISDQQNVMNVAEAFLNSNFRRFPIEHNGKIIGQISRRDVLRAISEVKPTTW